MKALVTGGAGFIGSHLVDLLLSKDCEVVVVDDLSTGRRSQVPEKAVFLQGNVGDAELLAKALPGCDVVFHLAAVSSVQDSLDRPIEVHNTNLTATLALLEAAVCHKVPRFVFSSSAAVYGDTGGEPAREDMMPKPMSHYAVQKLASENYCQVYHRLHGLETVCLRYFNVYGPRQRSDSPYSGVIAKFIDAARAGQPITIFGDGEQTRDFCHVKDVALANYLVATRLGTAVAGGFFNIGTGQSISVKDLARVVLAAFGYSAEQPTYGPPRAAEIRYSRADISKSLQALAWQPVVSLDEHSIAMCGGGL
jgi:nucleoside-diphosphate-sugar epimerase